MEWNKGYSATYYMTHVDPVTWRDTGTINLTGGTISRDSSGLLQSADIDCIGYEHGESWVRVYLDARQDGSGVHEALFTGLATSPDDQIDGTRVDNAVQCYSVLKPAEDVVLLRGWYAPRGANGGAVIKQLLSVTPAPVEVADNAPSISENIIAEEGENRLTMIEKILTAIDWRIKIAGDGTIMVEPKATEPSAILDPITMDVIEPGIKVKNDWYECPNIFLAIDDDLTAIARDDSADSPLSTVNRGREVWMVEEGCELAEGETIAGYAGRRLAEEQQYEQTASYDRRYMPDVYPSDLIRLRYPAQGLDGVYEVANQKIDLGYAARTSEEIKGTIKLQMSKEDTEVDTNLYALATDDGYVIAASDGNPIAAYVE